ncbi:MAG: DUF421 domain-containing protein [Acetobacteraceae bacterium]
MSSMFFDSWGSLVRIAVVGTLAYLALILLLRISGSRTLAKLNAFDLIVTVSLGSTLATVMLNSSIALAEGLLAFALLVGLQYVVAWLSVRSERFDAIVKSEPALLFHRGRFLEGMMRQERVTREEVLSAIRASGGAQPQDMVAVVLETDGSLSVIPSGQGQMPKDPAALRGVRRPDAEEVA